jgi:hypothetical protein
MFNKYYLILVAASLSSASVSAEQWTPNQWYIDGGLGSVNFNDGYDQVTPKNIYVRGGYFINQNFNIGLESNVTISPDQVAYAPGIDYSVNIGTIYFRAGAPVSDNVVLYGQIGSSNTELSGEYSSVKVTASDRDTMLGVGAEIGFGASSTYAAINYSKYNNNSGVDVSGLTFGIGTRF